MKASILALLASAAGIVVARNCQNLTIPVSITSRNGVFDVQPTQNNIEVTNFVLAATQQGHNGTVQALTGYADVSGTYDLSATYCTPDGGAGRALQILTHGVGFDRSYWDLAFNNYNYSYVAKALEAGYSTLSYDRLGIGQSARADPIAEIQAFLEIASLVELTKLVKAGSVSGIPAYNRIYHAGHSFGAIQTYALIRDHPDLSSGAILQGFSQNGTFLPYFLFGGNWVAVQTTPLASSYPAGYFATGNPSAVQSNFFSPGQFDPAMLDLASTTGQPVSQGELLTIGGAAAGVNTFAGPVLIITGSCDLPFCGGDCTITGDPSLPDIISSSIASFPNTKAEVVVVPEAGHGLNMEYSHEYTYSTMLEFLAASEVANGPVRREWKA